MHRNKASASLHSSTTASPLPPPPQGQHFITGRELEGIELHIRIFLTLAADREGDIGVAGAPVLGYRLPIKPGVREILTVKNMPGIANTPAGHSFDFAPAQVFRGETAKDCSLQDISK